MFNEPLHQNEEWLYDKYVVEKITMPQIAELVGVNKSTIGKWLKKFNIKARDISTCQQPHKKLYLLHSKEWLEEQYLILKKSTNEIAEQVGSVNSVVGSWLKKHGIAARTIGESRLLNPKINIINDDKTITDMYLGGKTAREIAKELNCSIQTVLRRLEKSDIKPLTANERVLLAKPTLQKLRNKQWLYQKYIVNDSTTVSIAEELKTNHVTVCYWLKKHGIPIKPSSESHSKERYSDNDLAQLLLSLSKQLGRIPSVRDLNEYCKQGVCPSAATYSLRGGMSYWQKYVFGKRNRSWLEWQRKCIAKFNEVLDNPKFKAEKTFEWLRSPITGYKLKIDAYYPDYNLCVEFDGEGHFKPIQFLKGQNAERQFQKTQVHDAVKNTEIPLHSLKLIRFKYDEPLTREHILERLSEANINFI